MTTKTTKTARTPTTREERKAAAARLMEGGFERRPGASSVTVTKGRPGSATARTAAARIARLKRTRDLRLKNAAGRRRTTGNLDLARAMATAARLRGRKR